MEFESEGMTPPSSPIFGYSGLRDEESIIDSGIVFCFNCKGEPRRNDYSFSPEGCILRREVITALEILNVDDSLPTQGVDKPQLVKFFGYSFDLLDKGQLKTLIAMCRKTVASLEILSDSSHSYIPGPFGGLGFDRNVNAVAADDPDELQNQNPWVFRKSVCYFLNMTVRKIQFYRRAWKGKDFEDMFIRFRKSIGSVKDWSIVLRNHCGFRSGNECSSSTYHLFHLQLELRWSFIIIFGASSSIIQWLLDDLINLAMFKYTIDSNEPKEPSLEDKPAFNCVCVKELWTMVKLVVDELRTAEYLQYTFWEFYAQAMERASVVSRTDIFFPMWLTSNLAHINEYSIAGVYCSGRGKEESKNGNNGYKYLHSIFEEWGKRGGKSIEVLKMSFNFLQHWGEDSKTLLVLWYQWIPRLNQYNDVTCIASYERVGNWVSLILNLLEINTVACDGIEDGLNSHSSVFKNPFLEFLALLAGHAKLCSVKELKKLKSNICMKLTTNNSTNYEALGIIRVSTLFMVLMAVTVSPQEAVSTCERLQDILNYGKSPNSIGRRKTIFRAYSTIIILLLRKKCVIRDAKLTTIVMKEFNDLLSQSSSSSDGVQKELAMIYIEMLECLPKYSPKFGNISLGRDILISPNLLMWLSNCGSNYVLRTIRALSQITEWILTFEISENMLNESPACSEHKELFFKIRDKCLPFLKSCVVLSINRIPSTDMEPLASLAANITILTRKFSIGSKTQDEIAFQFDCFAMNERTCPIFSQCYVSRILQNKEFVDNNFADLRFIQCWIRLIALDVHIPNQLTERVLGAASTCSNQVLLNEFCKKEDAWGRDEIQKIFNPLAGLVKGVMSETLFKEGQGSVKVDSENVITSVISSCSLVLRRIKFCNIYLKGDATSMGHNLLDSLVFSSWPGPPPWERFSASIMRALEGNIFEIFLAIVTYTGTCSDPYLRRKLQDIVVFSFFGFVRSPDEVDKDQHPCFKIFNYCEDNNITFVQNQVLPTIVAGEHVVKDVKLSQQLVRAVGLIRSKGFATLAIRVLAGLLRVYLSHSFEKIGSGQQHPNVIYCCQFGTTPFYKEMVVDAFRTVLVKEKKFAFSYKRVFQLCNVIAKSDKPKARTFLKGDVIPMLEGLVESTETLRGNGFDNSLRAPMEALRKELATV
ncbi:unnamed protein product [Orchesella dallaii]|uniref:Protein MMS22-like n=1 Tax=Orchesella dallaii TaxID=48710 RepID=A0ABP1PZ43_9HEXA